MSFSFKTSVIIPVYNAAKYVERAIESAIHQEGVEEVIVIDDGYQDGAIDICLSLQKKYPKLRLFKHPNNENLGAGASRNLGIKNARFEYIAFLDADDFYLENRFSITKNRFLENPQARAVYEPIGTHFVNVEAKKAFVAWKKVPLTQLNNYVTYPSKETSGKEFFLSLLHGDWGYPSIVGLTIKKEVFEKTELFNTSLRLHQDTDFMIRLAYNWDCIPGEKNHIVAMRTVHNENRISNLNFKSRYLLMDNLYKWAKTHVDEPDIRSLFKKKYITAYIRNTFNSNNIFVKVICRVINKFL